MRICLVPMKPLAGAKERLAPALDPDERRRLSLAMLADVVAAAHGFDRVWVLQSDGDAAAVAQRFGADPRPDPAPGRGLNASLDAATADAVAAGATGVLVVAADLAAATAEDLRALAQGDGVALAPDAGGSGTNALWRVPADVIGAAFGYASRAAHEAAAAAAGATFRTLNSPRLAADVDTSEALAAVWGLGPGPATRRALEDMGIAARLRLAG
jgi:2-phospho-L-lactate/phosphoenolpyruvate guanylyltransferase